MARHRILQIDLRPTWKEIRGKRPREFRRDVAGSGILQISLLPPLSNPNDQREVSQWLKTAIKNTPGIASVVAEQETTFSAGKGAFCLLQHGQQGLLAFWAISSELLIVATYVMGRLDTAQEEIGDAMAMMRLARFEEGDGSMFNQWQ